MGFLRNEEMNLTTDFNFLSDKTKNVAKDAVTHHFFSHPNINIEKRIFNPPASKNRVFEKRLYEPIKHFNCPSDKAKNFAKAAMTNHFFSHSYTNIEY